MPRNNSTPDFTIETDPASSVAWTRNGAPNITGLAVWTGTTMMEKQTVYIDPIGVRKHRLAKGGLSMNIEALDELAAKWLKERGYKVAPPPDPEQDTLKARYRKACEDWLNDHILESSAADEAEVELDDGGREAHIVIRLWFNEDDLEPLEEQQAA